MKYQTQIKLLLVLSIMLSMASCKKDSGGNTTSLSGFVKTKTTTNLTSSSKDEYFYDNNGNVISANIENNAGKFVFTYPSTNMMTMNIINATTNALIIHSDIYLNANKKQDSTFQYNDTQDSSTEKYIYNSSNQLIIFKRYIYSIAKGTELDETTSYQYNVNGNVISEQKTYPYSSTITVYTYQYTNYSNTIKYGNSYPFPVSPNLPLKKDMSNGGTLDTIDYTYTFDSNNRVATATQKHTYGTSVNTSTIIYTYY